MKVQIVLPIILLQRQLILTQNQRKQRNLNEKIMAIER